MFRRQITLNKVSSRLNVVEFYLLINSKIFEKQEIFEFYLKLFYYKIQIRYNLRSNIKKLLKRP